MSGPEKESIRVLPAARGLTWLSGSWALVRQQPLRLLLVSLFFQFFLSFSQADILGLLVVMCLPVLSAGMLHAFFLVERGERPILAVLFIPLTTRDGLGRLLLLGGIVLVLGLLLVSMMLSGEVADISPQVINQIEQGDLDALQFIDPKVMESAVKAMALAAIVSGAITYFSVPLIWFRKQPVGKSVLLGLKALGKNWKPLLLIGLLLGILAIPIVLLFASFYLTVLAEGAASMWLAFVLMVLGPMYQLLLFGTQYMAFRDIFGLEIDPDQERGSTKDQLVA